MKKLRITVEGKTYEVAIEILDEGTGAPAAVRPSVAPASATPLSSAAVTPPAASPKPAAVAAGGGPDMVASPLMGKIAAVQVTVGQQVQQGQELITIEAMKMNTFVYAPKAGLVAEIFVNSGDAVEEGQALVRLS